MPMPLPLRHCAAALPLPPPPPPQVKETHKIWGEGDVAITATCIRVPVMRAHAESINLEFERDISGTTLLALVLLLLLLLWSC